MTDALVQLIDRGKKAGKLEAIERVVRNMTADGAPFEQIVKYTGASADDVQKIMDRIAADNQAQLF